MKRGILCILLVFIFSASYGQGKTGQSTTGTIVGKLIDSTSNLPLESATVTLCAAGKSKVIQRTTTDSKSSSLPFNQPPCIRLRHPLRDNCRHQPTNSITVIFLKSIRLYFRGKGDIL